MGLAKSNQKSDFTKPRPASFMPSQGPAQGLPSPLGQVMSSQATSARRKKDMNTPLLLTALVDAFSILVIFLLVQIAGVPNEFEATDKLKLPRASSVSDVAAISKDEKPVISNLIVINGQYKLDGVTLSLEGLRQQLVQLKKQSGPSVRVIIQADQGSDFDMIAPILSATATAGISNLEFAVESVAQASVPTNKQAASSVRKM